MGAKKRTWVRGCAVGCGLTTAVLIAAGMIVGWRISATLAPIRHAEKVHRQLSERYGEFDTYVPAPDGAIPRERLETFLAIRDSLVGARAELKATFVDFPPDALIHDNTSSLFAKVTETAGTLGVLIRGIGRYVDARHQALLDREMGVGEYVYIYSTAYHSWLGHDVTDRPVITKPVDRTSSGWRTGDATFKEDHDVYGIQALRRRYRSYLGSILQNQLSSLPEDADEAWRDRLAAEIRRLRADPHAVAWEDGLPDPIRESLEPLRARIEALYDATSNCFEIPPEDHELTGGYTVTLN